MYFLKSSVTFKVHRAHVATFLQLGVVLLSWNTEKQCWSLMSREVYKKKLLPTISFKNMVKKLTKQA